MQFQEFWTELIFPPTYEGGKVYIGRPTSTKKHYLTFLSYKTKTLKSNLYSSHNIMIQLSLSNLFNIIVVLCPGKHDYKTLRFNRFS